MTCADVELLICDYVDGTLGAAERQEVERHLAECPQCAELARDSAAAVAFMERVPDVEPPPELLTRMLFDAPWAKSRKRAGGIRTWLKSFWQPILQPRFAMGMAMTILSFAMLAQFVPFRQIRSTDLDPAAVWAALDNRIYRAWQRTVKFYESLRVVYQVQSTVREWQQAQEEERKAAEQDPGDGKADERRLPVKGPEQK